MTRGADTSNRRTFVKVAGGTVVGLSVGAGTVGARGKGNGMGGTGFTTQFNVDERGFLDWDAFEFVEENRFTLEQAPGCTNGRPKEYQGWDVEEVGGGRSANFWVAPDRNVNTGVSVEIRSHRSGCEGTVLDEDGEPFGENPRDTYKITFGDA
jgi:hypothetical protein